MMYVRTRYLCVCVAVADAAVVAGGVPLQHYSWSAVHDPSSSVHTLGTLLLANTLLLLVVLAGFAAALALSKRAWMFSTRYGLAYVRSNLARRVRRRQ
jgi:hypothetical protein